MAISIDDVYQKVLAIANKEQRGYITPQEFNLFADHAQKEIFEQYFYDLNQFNRIPGNSMGHSDMKDIIESKISAFEVWTNTPNTIVLNNDGDINLGQFPLYRVLEVMVDYKNNEGYKVVEEVTAKEYRKYTNSPLAKESVKRPVYIHDASGFDRIKIIPAPTDINDAVKISYIKKPSQPKWGYIVSQNSNTALWFPGDSTDFELHPSEEAELVYKILKLAGVSMIREDIMRAGQGMESVQIQQEKQ
tara:strand:- start:1034 stop:1774 length:741 start_codon:yes stop_codon:yes gene_type:complete